MMNKKSSNENRELDGFVGCNAMLPWLYAWRQIRDVESVNKGVCTLYAGLEMQGGNIVEGTLE